MRAGARSQPRKFKSSLMGSLGFPIRKIIERNKMIPFPSSKKRPVCSTLGVLFAVTTFLGTRIPRGPPLPAHLAKFRERWTGAA